jgi:hypothetical protein
LLGVLSIRKQRFQKSISYENYYYHIIAVITIIMDKDLSCLINRILRNTTWISPRRISVDSEYVLHQYKPRVDLLPKTLLLTLNKQGAWIEYKRYTDNSLLSDMHFNSKLFHVYQQC